MNVARGLTETCWKLYTLSRSTGAESLYVTHRGKLRLKGVENLLRPEVAESLYIMYRVTGESKYKERAWQMFLRYRKHSRVAGGYATIANVNSEHILHRDKMETFWVAETLKYLWLAQANYTFDLNQWVFNTEAHLLPVVQTMRQCENPLNKHKRRHW